MLCLFKFLVLLFLHNHLNYNHSYHCDLTCSNDYGNVSVSVTFVKFRGRYLSRIPYPSNGIKNLENAKLMRQTTHISIYNSSCEGIVCSFHFQNYCFTHFGVFSCAVDCFLELSYAIFWTHLHNTSRDEFSYITYESYNARQKPWWCGKQKCSSSHTK